MELDVVVLAGGKGKRMHSDIPKVLHRLAGIPMVERVVNSAKALNPSRIHIIYNKEVPQVREQMAHLDVNWVMQSVALGTSHALMQALPDIPDGHQVLALNGDAPLLLPETLQALVDSAPQNGLSIMITHLDDPSGYGRIIRSYVGNIVDIIEQKDATPEQRQIKEVYPGIVTAGSTQLKKWLPQITNDNAQQEYYLTDIVKVAIANGSQIDGTLVDSEIELRGVNNLRELMVLEKHFYRERCHKLVLNGVTIRDPERFILRGDLDIGRDSVIDVNVLIEGEVKIGDNSIVGANTIIEDSNIGNHVRIDPNCIIRHQMIPSGSHVKYMAQNYEIAPNPTAHPNES